VAGQHAFLFSSSVEGAEQIIPLHTRSTDRKRNAHDVAGFGKMCLPFLVARILRGGMGQGAWDLGRRTGVVVDGKSRFLDFGDDPLSRIIPLRSE
jgi:hypothetical protein